MAFYNAKDKETLHIDAPPGLQTSIGCRLSNAQNN